MAEGTFFSIVIPTMDRHETLPSTLKTCLAQSYHNFEVVVSDNWSTPETRAVAESFDSAKIRYVRTDQRLPMTESFEFAVSHATGDYVIVLGDDDGLMRHALYELDRIIARHRPKAIRWDRIRYSWPNMIPAEVAGRLYIPLGDDRVTLVKARKVLNRIANCRLDYQLLPMLYNSAVSRELILALRERTGRVFNSRTPDVYSGFALAYLADEYLSASLPMTINAGSAKSNGYAATSQGEGNAITEGFLDLNARFGLHLHRSIPDVIAMPVTIADCFMFAKDTLFPAARAYRLDHRNLVGNILRASAATGGLEKAVAAIREKYRDDPGLLRWLDGVLPALKPSCGGRPAPSSFSKGVRGGCLHLKAQEFGATDVAGVAELCDRLMGYAESSFSWEFEDNLTRARKCLASGAGRLSELLRRRLRLPG